MFVDFHTHQPSSGNCILNRFPLESLSLNEYFSMGIHPWYIHEANLDDEIQSIIQLVSSNHLLMIGECGLDKIKGAEWELQKRAFHLQIELANNYRKPLIIHCVKAFNEVIVTLQKYAKTRIVFHGFNGSPEMIKQLAGMGYYFSLGLNQLSGLKGMQRLKAVPSDRLFFETDDSHIDIMSVYDEASAILNLESEALCLQIAQNVNNFFGRHLFDNDTLKAKI